eukprot:68638_1
MRTAVVQLVVVISVLYPLAIIQTYAFCRFKSIQNLVIIQKRYPKIVITEAIVTIFNLLIAIPLWTNMFIQGTSFGIKSAEPFFFYWASGFALWTTQFIIIIEATRLWLVSYNLHYIQASKNKQWKSQIDASVCEKDWYLKNRNTYGNP